MASMAPPSALTNGAAVGCGRVQRSTFRVIPDALTNSPRRYLPLAVPARRTGHHTHRI